MSRLLLFLGLASLACSQQPADTQLAAVVQPVPVAEAVAQVAPLLTETFETGRKGAYATADETLPSGSWRFTEAMIGSSEQDHKAGQRAARLRTGGRLGMNFDAALGVRTIRVSSASYGTDDASTWELWLSQDGGRHYVRIGQPVRTTGDALRSTAFTVPQAGLVRVEIRKVDSGKGRLNIDDVELLRGSGATPAVPSAPVATPPPAGPTPVATPNQDSNLLLGNPSGATASLSTPTNYLLVKPQYTLGYNAQRGTPTWVSWHLSKAEMGTAPRQDDFRPDPALPRQFYQVTSKSYGGSGFDKGHNCPSADRTYTLDDNSATFLMTNMIPQAPNNNQRTWSALEEYGRSLVKKGQEIYIIMGSYGKGGTGSNGPVTTIDQGRVTVPKRVWKVLVVLPEGTNDLQRIAAGQARIIAIDTPNDNGVSPNWGQYRVSLDALEAATGLDLLSALPSAAQTRLQAGIDTGPTR